MLFDPAGLAGDLAAPLEATVAVESSLSRSGSVASAAAEQIAAIDAW